MTTTLQKNNWPLQRDAVAFYGNPYKPGFMANLTQVACPWKFTTGHNMITSHKKCAESLLRVLNKTWDDIQHDLNHLHTLGYDVFDGSYVVRAMRGGAAMSMHSLGVAFDFDAAANQQHSLKHLFQLDSPLIANFLAESWVWGGQCDPSSIDAMHVQAARVHP